MSSPPMGTVVSSVMKEESGSEREENEAWKGPDRTCLNRAL